MLRLWDARLGRGQAARHRQHRLRVYADDHRPAHFHVVAPDFKAMVDIETLAVIRGSIPARDRRAVMDWAVTHQARITAAWNALNPDLAI